MAGNNSKAMKEWWRRATAEQRHAATAAAHAARRGKKDPLKLREARATARYVSGVGIGPHEVTFAKMLDTAGIKYRQQVACGPYNIDFTVASDLVAVEIRTGAGNHRVAKMEIERRNRILNE